MKKRRTGSTMGRQMLARLSKESQERVKKVVKHLLSSSPAKPTPKS